MGDKCKIMKTAIDYWVLISKFSLVDGKCDELWKIVICELNILKKTLNCEKWTTSAEYWSNLRKSWKCEKWIKRVEYWTKSQNEWNPGNNWNWYKCIRKYLLLMKKSAQRWTSEKTEEFLFWSTSPENSNKWAEKL